MRSIGLRALFAGVLSLAATLSGSAQILQNMGVPLQVFPGPISTEALAINNSGVAVGVSFNGLVQLPMYSTGGGTATIIGPSTNVDDGYAPAINSSGTVIATINNQYYLYSIPNNTLTDISPSVGAATGLPIYGGLVLTGINDSGQIVGVDGSTFANSFIYSGGSATMLPNVDASAINNAGQVTGQDEITDQAFIYSGGVVTGLGTLGGQYSNGSSINNLGQVTGQADVLSTDTESVTDPFIYSNGVMTDLGNLGVYDFGGFDWGVGVGNSINDLGQVVGYSFAGADDQDDPIDAAFLYTDGQMYNMNQLYGSLLSNGSAPGFINLDDATGINDAGQIVGYGEYFDGTNTYEEGFILNANEFGVPDSAQSITLLLIGVAALTAYSARRGSVLNG